MLDSKPKRGFALVTVSVEYEYLIPLARDEARDRHGVHIGPIEPEKLLTQLDGRTLADIMDEWFKRFPATHSHASRTAYRCNKKYTGVKSVAIQFLAL